jgi:phosphoribosylanthranilate isomerase
MLVKVRGLRDNWKEVSELQPDLLGLIFYPKSSRFIELDGEKIIATDIPKVGVFVKASAADIIKKVAQYQLSYVQLHGDESVEFIEELKKSLTEIKIIKVFRVQDELPDVKEFEHLVDLFLFDTKVSEYGGTGSRFDWDILRTYSSSIPFLIAGGVDEQDIQNIKSLQINGFIGVDINSKFEDEPGLKNIEKVSTFIKAIRDE